MDQLKMLISSLLLLLGITIIFGCNRLDTHEDNEGEELVDQNTDSTRLGIRLIDAKNLSPLSNERIMVLGTMGIVYDASSPKDTIEIIKTNSEGITSVSKKILDIPYDVYLIFFDSKNKGVRMATSDSTLYQHLYMPGSGHTIGANVFNIETKQVKRLDQVRSHTTIEPYSVIEFLVDTEKNRSHMVLAELSNNKKYYSKKQHKFWKYLWNHFKKGIGGDMKDYPFPSTWDSYVRLSLRTIGDLNLDVVIEVYEDSPKVEKRYNLLVGIYTILIYKQEHGIEIEERQKNRIESMFIDFHRDYPEYISKLNSRPYFGGFLEKGRSKIN